VFEVKGKWLNAYNRPGFKITPLGFVIHSTANPGATAQNHFDYWCSKKVSGSAHKIADWKTIYNLIPENEGAWHAGKTANSRFISLEMCEPSLDDPNRYEQFDEVWNRTVWAVADACVRYKWNTDDNVFSHRGISQMWHETDHIDPIPFLIQYGRTWEQLLSAIDKEIEKIKKGGEESMAVLEKSVLLFTEADKEAGFKVAAKNGNCAIFVRNSDHSVPTEAMLSKKLLVIGGSTVNHPNETVLSGKSWAGTAYVVGKYLGDE